MDQAERKPIARRRKPIKAAAALAHDIVDHIIDQKLSEGDRLPAEKQMIADTGRARGTLREALSLLESLGVVQIRQGTGGGPFVRRPRPADLGEALTLLLVFEQASIMDLIDARSEIEMLVVMRAGKRITAHHIERLKLTVTAQQENIENREYFLAQSRLFHQIVNESSGSLVLNLINQALISTMHSIFVPLEYPIAHRRRVIKSHLAIIAALEEGNIAKACAAMQSHVEDSAQRWRKLAGPQADRPLRWTPLHRVDG